MQEAEGTSGLTLAVGLSRIVCVDRRPNLRAILRRRPPGSLDVRRPEETGSGKWSGEAVGVRTGSERASLFPVLSLDVPEHEVDLFFDPNLGAGLEQCLLDAPQVISLHVPEGLEHFDGHQNVA